MDFEKVCMMFSMQEPFYGVILSSMEKVQTDKIDTFGVARSGNVFKLYYNPKFYEKLSTECTLQILKHETLHIAFNHFELWEPSMDPDENKLRNCAEDLEINCYIDRSKMDKEAGGLFVEDFGFDRMLGSRAYYDLINKKFPQTEEAQNPTKPCNGGQGGQSSNSQSQASKQDASSQPQNQLSSVNSNEQSAQSTDSDGSNPGKSDRFDQLPSSFDDHSMWPDSNTDDMEQLQQIINELLDFAAEECEKNQGTIPGEMVGKIEEIRKKPKPVADWKRYFRRYMGNEFSEFIRKSKKRESKRFPDAAGNRHRRKSHILVGIDTSGSVSMPEYVEFFGQIKTLVPHADFHVVECDARVQHEYDYNGKCNMVLHGGGGTDFQPVIDIYNQNRRKYDALVYFTDGGAEIPKDTPKDCLWVISSRGIKDPIRYKVNGASVVFIPESSN